MLNIEVQSINLKQMFFEMLRIRLIEEAIVKHYAKQEMRCPVHLSIGQEAVAVGVCAGLTHHDRIMSGHRAHAHYLAKGGNLKKFIAEIYGKASGCCAGVGGSMHLVDLSVGMCGSTPIVGGTFPVAVGLAWAAKLQKQDIVTAVFFGEGMTEEGVFAEGLNFASLKDLPILLVCENNLYSVYSPLSVRQHQKRSVQSFAHAHHIRSYLGDGNDLEEVSQISSKAIQEIKEHQRPVLIEFNTYRFREHCGPNFDNHIGYRTEQEFLLWEKRCPIRLLQNKLIEEGQLLHEDLEQMHLLINQEIEEAFEFSQNSAYPNIQGIEKKVYAQ